MAYYLEGTEMKRILLFSAFFVLMLNTSVYAEGQRPELMDKIINHRISIYEKLNLSDEQTNQIKEIDNRRYSELEPEIVKISNMTKKLENIAESENCTIKSVNEVKKEFKPVQKDLNRINNKFEKEFKQVLTSEQKLKYKQAKIQKRKELKEEVEKQKAALMEKR